MNITRTRLAAMAVAMVVISVFAGNDAFRGVELRGETDRNPVTYRVGEPIEFRIDVAGVGRWPDDDCYFVEWLRTGDDGVTSQGVERVSARKTNLVVRTALNSPGFVRLQARLMDADYNPVVVEDQGRMTDIAFHGGAGAGVETLRQAVPEPLDFDAFWVRQKKRLEDVPMRADLRDAPQYSDGRIRTWTVRIDCAGPRPATGYLSIPNGAKSRSLKAVVIFNGYGAQVKGQPVPNRMKNDEMVFRLNAFGYEMEEPPEYYRAFFKSCRTAEYTYALDPKENADPENCFFNGMALRLLRALEYVKSRPEWNGRDLAVEGNSQGGLQAMWAAGLDSDVTLSVPAIVWCCDLGGSEAGRLGAGWGAPYVPGLRYYDAVNFAKRVKGEVRIRRAGLGDYVCPPSGLAVLFNAIPTSKSIDWYQGSRHSAVPRSPKTYHVDGNKAPLGRMGTIRLTGGALAEFRSKCQQAFVGVIDPKEHVAALTEIGPPKDMSNKANARPEYAGQYLDLCATYWELDRMPEAKDRFERMIRAAASGIGKAGYLGGEFEDCRRKRFSLWNQAHVVYGLSRCAKAFGSVEAESLATRAANWLMSTWEDMGTDVITTADAEGSENLVGLYSCVGMYDLTCDWRYMDFVDRMLGLLEHKTDMKLLSARGCLDLPSRKGIEMLNCMRGVLGFGCRAGKGVDAIAAAGRYWRSIADTQVRSTGSSTAVSQTEIATERFTIEGNTPRILTSAAYANENCVQCGWMRFTREYFDVTRDPRCIDEMQRTLYNHLLGSAASDGSDFAYYQGNVGRKVFRKNYFYQCCRYRGFAIAAHLPELVLNDDGSIITPLAYTPLTYRAADGFELEIRTDYPADGEVVIRGGGGKGRELHVKVPFWSGECRLAKNGKDLDVKKSGEFLPIRFVAEGRDELVVRFKMEFRAKPCTIDGREYVEYSYGPLVLVRDTHFGDRLGEPIPLGQKFRKVSSGNESFVRFETQDSQGRVHTLVDFAHAGRHDPEKDEFELYIPTRGL